MRVFVTGATGWVGSALVKELLGAGHEVLGLVRTEDKAATLRDAGAQARLGDIDDLDGLRAAAADADAVVHTAFKHDFSRFAESGEADQRAIEALGGALEGSERPIIATSGLALIAPGRLATEADPPPADPSFPRQSEAAAARLRARGVRAASVRFAACVHGVGEHGFLAMLIDLARETGISAFVGDGANRWPGVHRLDAARLYRLALEHGTRETVYHGVADEGIAFKDIAEVIGRRLGVAVEPRPADHFRFLALFAGADMPASSARTRERLGWTPTGPGLLADLDQPGYFDR